MGSFQSLPDNHQYRTLSQKTGCEYKYYEGLCHLSYIVTHIVMFDKRSTIYSSDKSEMFSLLTHNQLFRINLLRICLL